jgi:predicted regulator of Ras-like GTPase activity (Roadblock/LC7/MglB family)
LTGGLDQALDDALNSVPECLVVGYLNLTTGVLVGVRTASNHPQEALDLVSTVAAGLFDDANLSAVERWMVAGQDTDEGGDAGVQELVVMSDRFLHLFTRCKANRDHAAVFVARKSANIGLAITRSRKAANALDQVA